jgi:hypothetical protein
MSERASRILACTAGIVLAPHSLAVRLLLAQATVATGLVLIALPAVNVAFHTLDNFGGFGRFRIQ